MNFFPVIRGLGAIHLVRTQKIGLFDPPPPPGTQNDVTVTINWPLLRTHLATPPLPPRCVRTKWMPPKNIFTLDEGFLGRPRYCLALFNHPNLDIGTMCP